MIMTRRLAVAEFRTGFEIMRAGTCGKIVLDWKAE
jgi:threonine 3-dehydrogenase